MSSFCDFEIARKTVCSVLRNSTVYQISEVGVQGCLKESVNKWKENFIN